MKAGGWVTSLMRHTSCTLVPARNTCAGGDIVCRGGYCDQDHLLLAAHDVCPGLGDGKADGDTLGRVLGSLTEMQCRY